MVINQFRHRGAEQEDLFQIAALGLIKAIDNFNPAYGTQLSTYAIPVMMGEIKRFFRDDSPIRVSRSYKLLASKAAVIREQLAAKTGKEPTVKEIAAKLSVAPEDLSVALSAVQPPASLDEAYGESDITLKEQLADNRSSLDIIEELALRESINNLPERERNIILWRYIEEHSQAKIAERLGISQVQVSRLERKILLKLRSQL